MAATNEDWEDVVDELCEVEEGLYPNEIDFIESLANQHGRELSDKQVNWLNKIAERLL